MKNRRDIVERMSQSKNPFAAYAGYGQLRCIACWKTFDGWNRAVRCVSHYLQECNGELRDQAVRSYVYFVLGRIELRLNQRALLRYAHKAGFFAVGEAPDSVSLHSLRRAGLVTLSGHVDAPLLERFWHITRLGELVLVAYALREQEIDARERASSRPQELGDDA